jgi:hypothetical protein
MLGKTLRRVGLVLLVLVVVRVIIGLFVPSLNINDVTTGATPEYPDLQPQRFAAPAAHKSSTPPPPSPTHKAGR